MGFMTIDGQRVEFTNEPNVLTVIRNAEIDIPTLCYHSELSIYGACRLCTVEDDRGKTFASCAEPPRDGMVIYTNTPRLMRYRRTILELLLAAHDRDCTTCVKSGECHLLELAHRMGVDRIRFKNREAKYPIDESSPAIVRNPNKCILCGDCVRMCDNVQSVNAIDFAYRGTSTLVTPAFNKTIAQTNCVNCGQCRVVCPTGAISIKTNIDEVWDALADPNTIVVAQVAPAVRVALGDKFGIPKGENVMGKLVNALHRLGFHEVYDTTYGADLTVIEEAEELLERLQKYLDRTEREGMITRELLVALRTDLTQVVYAWLSEREIKAYALFADADMENLHRNSLYGREEMMEYAGVLVRKAVQYRQYINKSDSVTSQVCAYIDAHYREEIHREELGELVFLNTDYLSRIFKKEKGISISNYIIQKRVEEAKKLLTQSSLPINTVSLYVGYSNFSYFTKMFKDNTGYAPLEYRRSFSEK